MWPAYGLGLDQAGQYSSLSYVLYLTPIQTWLFRLCENGNLAELTGAVVVDGEADTAKYVSIDA